MHRASPCLNFFSCHVTMKLCMLQCMRDSIHGTFSARTTPDPVSLELKDMEQYICIFLLTKSWSSKRGKTCMHATMYTIAAVSHAS